MKYTDLTYGVRLTTRRPRAHIQTDTQALRSSLCRSQCSHDYSTPNQGVSDHLQPLQVRKNVRPSLPVSITPAGGRHGRTPAAHVRGEGLVRSKCPITARLVLAAGGGAGGRSGGWWGSESRCAKETSSNVKEKNAVVGVGGIGPPPLLLLF